MENLKSKLTAKIIAVVLVIVSMTLLIAGFAGMMAMDAVGGYQVRKEDMLKKAYEQACSNYSAAAMAGYFNQYDADELQLTNFRYAIIRADSPDDVDVNDSDSYAVTTFDRIPDPKELHWEEYAVNEDTFFTIEGNTILDADYRMHSEEYQELSYPITEWLYDLQTDTFYVLSEDGLFPVTVKDGMISYEEDWEYQEQPLRTIRTFIVQQEAQDGSTIYTWKNQAQVQLHNWDVTIAMDDIQIVDGEYVRLEDYGEIQKQSPDYFDYDGSCFYIRHKNNMDHYIVASYVKEPLEGAASFLDGDMFVQANMLVNFAYRMRYVGIAIAIVSLMVLFVAFSFLMAAAGHHRGKEGICPSFMDYVPLDLYAVVVILVETAVFYTVVAGMNAAANWSRNNFSGILSSAVIVILASVIALLIAVAFCMSFAVRVKMGKWWRHTVVYLIARKCFRFLAKVLRVCGYVAGNMCRSMTLLWKAWFVLGFLAFLEFAALEACWADARLVMLWLLEKIGLYSVVILALMQMHRLQKGARQIAGGQLDYQIDTRHMFWEIRRHGEYLNDIGHGINSAVNERMKSEHFKTELITNVSHDIKTPLTSIINYVDLLQKEEINNPTVQEYLEVLHRQSARLKKLIEDLMEASKASTGSLNVVMEKCDAGVMLIQTIGEFEEKLMAEQIELQVKKPDTEIFIEADHRHLWRVFDNLMNNICKYAQSSTRAYVNLEQNGQQAVIIFRNISRYQLNISSEELMERFVRGDSSRNTEGSGLGISIAKSLTELMNGTFELIVDGDLFKVILTFPVYGMGKMRQDSSVQQMHGFEKDDAGFGKKERSFVSGIQNAGSYAAGLGQGVADKTGRMVRRAGKYAHHVRQAIQQVKAEETAQTAAYQQQNGNADGFNDNGQEQEDFIQK